MDTHGIGARVRMVRNARGLSIRTLADLAGISKSVLHEYEVGDRPLERLSDIDALSIPLGVSRDWLLGRPADPTSPAHADGHDRAARLRAALIDTELNIGPDHDRRPLPILVDAADDLWRTHMSGDITTSARRAPDILTELHSWAVNGDDQEQTTAGRAFVVACAAAGAVAKWLGFLDLAWTAATQGRRAAVAVADPVLTGFAEFCCSHALAPYSRAYANSAQALAVLQPHASDTPLGMQVYGMLHQMAAFGAAVTGRAADVTAHMAEAADLAARTGDRDDLALYFGPTNLDVWRVSIAVEQGEGGRAAEIARKVDVRAMPSTGRQATFYADLGRGFAQERRDGQALNAFLTSERLSPDWTHENPLVREATEGILRRAVRASTSAELRSFARRVGTLP